MLDAKIAGTGLSVSVISHAPRRRPLYDAMESRTGRFCRKEPIANSRRARTGQKAKPKGEKSSGTTARSSTISDTGWWRWSETKCVLGRAGQFNSEDKIQKTKEKRLNNLIINSIIIVLLALPVPDAMPGQESRKPQVPQPSSRTPEAITIKAVPTASTIERGAVNSAQDIAARLTGGYSGN